MRLRTATMTLKMEVRIRKADNGWIIYTTYDKIRAKGIVDHVTGDYAEALARMFLFLNQCRDVTARVRVLKGESS